jgi:hypothetical protein
MNSLTVAGAGGLAGESPVVHGSGMMGLSEQPGLSLIATCRFLGR